MDRFDPFVKYADVYGDIINWEKDPMNKPQNQNKYFFSDGKTYYEQICKMLRLMSVFKEAFNQIYSNEDEISEAWENFVNNLSASVVEGSEPDVTLTWTDDSVNFEFTMVPGVPGEQGVGITSISFNSDYTMTITLSDGNTYTSMSLKGETGPQGPQGETGSGLQILDVYATLADLQSAHPAGQPGDAYQVGSAGNYTLYIWSSSQSAWVPAGSLGTVSPSTSNPLMDGTASAGSSDLYSRGDHVHPTDTSRASKEELDALIKTSQALIDQSFTCRESPAIQDGLARFDKIKGNTLAFNQLVQNGDFSNSTTGWGLNTLASHSVSNNVLTFVSNSASGGIYQNNKTIQGHKYLFGATLRSSVAHNFYVGSEATETSGYRKTVSVGTSNTRIEYIFTASQNGRPIVVYDASTSNFPTNYVSNCILVDLTLMYGQGNEPTVEQFKSYFPLPYYSYQSTLLPFKGTSIKTVGKNLLPKMTPSVVNGITWTVNEDGTVVANGTASANADAQLTVEFTLLEGNYYFNGCPDGGNDGSTWNCYIWDLTTGTRAKQWDRTSNVLNNTSSAQSRQFYSNGTNRYAYNCRVMRGQTVSNLVFKPMVRLSSADDVYEPYTSSTLSLPISTYFPNGMKSVGSVYDELLPNKAITRVGMVDLGTLTWTYSTDEQIFSTNGATDRALTQNGICSKYENILSWSVFSNSAKGLFIPTNSNLIRIRDTSYTNADALKSSLNGVYLYYELATPVETSISTELDLYFMAYEDGTEQLLPVNGPVPSTSPIIADITYLSIDDAMEYIIDKLANVPQNTQQILDSLEDDVADLQEDVGALQPAVSALQTSVGNINTNIGQLSSTVAGHTSSIYDINSDISDLDNSITSLEGTIANHTSRIGTLESGLSTTNGNVQNLETSVSDLDDTVTAQGTTVTALDSIISDISNNPVVSALGSHELGFVAAYVEATLPANAGTRVTIPKPVIFPNNYTPLFIVGMSTGSSDVSICEIPPTFGSRDSVSCRVWNHGSQQTAQVTVYILCMRQRQSQ